MIIFTLLQTNKQADKKASESFLSSIRTMHQQRSQYGSWWRTDFPFVAVDGAISPAMLLSTQESTPKKSVVMVVLGWISRGGPPVFPSCYTLSCSLGEPKFFIKFQGFLV